MKNYWEHRRRYENPPAPRKANMDKVATIALTLINSYGAIEGNHHKMWVIDQVVRILCVTDEKYQEWVRKHQQGEDGPETYEWETGIAP